MIKLITPQTGNVRTQARTISRTTLKFTAVRLFAAPAPMMALVFVWVVDTGMPKRLESVSYTHLDVYKRQASL